MSYTLGAAVGRVAAVATKRAVTGAGRSVVPVRRYSPVPKAILDKMNLFQAPNGLPVHIKGGVTDRVLFGITAVLCTIGVIDCFHVYYVLSYPPPQ